MVNIFWTLKETSRATKGKTSGFFDTLPQLYKDDCLAGLPPRNNPKCRPYRQNSLKGTGDLIPEPYLIFVISFTQTGFSKTKFYIQKTTKGTKNTKNVSKKSNICIFFHLTWKNLHLTENFYTDMSVVSVTNMRYGTL